MAGPTVVKTPLTLDSSKDWDDWYAAVRRTAKARGVLDLIDVDAVEPPTQPIRPTEPPYSDIKEEATSLRDLNAGERDMYRFLYQQYRTRLDLFLGQEKALADISDFVQSTISRSLNPYIRDLDTLYDILKALKKRVAPTDRARELELIREYKALQKTSRTQNTEIWLSNWETTYTKALKLSIPEVQGNRPLYDFVQAIKGLDSSYASAYQVYIDSKIADGVEIPTIFDAIERFRNNMRISRAESRMTSTSFATLGIRQDSPLRESTMPDRSSCLCGKPHFFSQCPYLIEEQRHPEWVPDDEIQAEIDRKLAANERLKMVIEEKQQQARNRKSRPRKSATTATTTEKEKDREVVSVTVPGAFTVKKGSHKLQNSWILDSGSDIHVCNDPKRFIFERKALKNDVVAAGKDIYPIEAFGSVEITVRTPKGPAKLTLANVALVPGFLTNTVAIKRFFKRGVYWDTRNQRMEQNEQTFCFIQEIGGHYALEHTPVSSITPARPAAFVANKASSTDSCMSNSAAPTAPPASNLAHFEHSALSTPPGPPLGEADSSPTAQQQFDSISTPLPITADPRNPPYYASAFAAEIYGDGEELQEDTLPVEPMEEPGGWRQQAIQGRHSEAPLGQQQQQQQQQAKSDILHSIVEDTRPEKEVRAGQLGPISGLQAPRNGGEPGGVCQTIGCWGGCHNGCGVGSEANFGRN